MNKQITIFIHGACSNNGQPNSKVGWAAVITNSKKQLRISAGESGTTNHRMELRAAIEGLQAIRNKNAMIEIVTDNRYFQQGCELWLEAWKERGWKRTGGESITNLDLWKEIDFLITNLKVRVDRIQHRNSNPLRFLTQNLASQAITRQSRLITAHKVSI